MMDNGDKNVVEISYRVCLEALWGAGYCVRVFPDNSSEGMKAEVRDDQGYLVAEANAEYDYETLYKVCVKLDLI